jgi:hypothetical protein
MERDIDYQRKKAYADSLQDDINQRNAKKEFERMVKNKEHSQVQ